MGDRRIAEIRVPISSEEEETKSLYVYTHGDGYVFDQMAKAAIVAAAPRWGDTPYATRIIVDQLIKGGRDKETGYGLMMEPRGEDSYNGDKPSIIIDLNMLTLEVYGEGQGMWRFATLAADAALVIS